MSNVIASTLFCIRNTDKVENGDVGRVPVAIGQARNVVNSVMSFDNAIGKTAQTAVDAFNLASKNEALLKYAGKAINSVGENINPLICVSSGFKVLNSDEPASAFVQQSSALAGMFTVEHLMKKHLENGITKSIEKISALKDKKGFEKIFKTAADFIEKHKLQGKLPKALYGALFVVGSCTAYTMGEKFGNLLTSEIKKEGRKEDKKENKA